MCDNKTCKMEQNLFLKIVQAFDNVALLGFWALELKFVYKEDLVLYIRVMPRVKKKYLNFQSKMMLHFVCLSSDPKPK